MNNNYLSKLKCSIVKNNEHFINDPISLECGHCICKNCLPKDKRKLVKCSICNNESRQELIDYSEQSILKKRIENSIPTLYNEIENDATANYSKLKTIYEETVERIDKSYQYIDDEIDIRIESMKNELDVFRDKLKEELLEKKNVFKKICKLHKIGDDEINKYEKFLDELRNKIKNKEVDDVQGFFEFQDNLIKMKNTINELENPVVVNSKINLESRKEIKKSMIGEVYIDSIRYLDNLKNGDYEIIKKNNQVRDACTLPGKRLVIACGPVICYNEDFNVCNIVKSINNGYPLKAYGVTTNNEYIYVLDYCFGDLNDGTYDECIHMLDLNFNYIKSIKTIERLQPNEFLTFNRFGFSFYNNCLYLSSKNNEVSIIDKTLGGYIDRCPLGKPIQSFQICKSTILTLDNNTSYLEFYDLNTYKLKKRYKNIKGKIKNIYVLDYHFYVITTDIINFDLFVNVYIFDIDGNYCEHADITNLDNYINDELCFHLTVFNNDLCLISEKGILKFE